LAQGSALRARSASRLQRKPRAAEKAEADEQKQVKQASETGLPPIDSDADQADHDWLAALRARGSCSLARSLPDTGLRLSIRPYECTGSLYLLALAPCMMVPDICSILPLRLAKSSCSSLRKEPLCQKLLRAPRDGNRSTQG
jgi:hypothetical protein